jgi:hypothetical protein
MSATSWHVLVGDKDEDGILEGELDGIVVG